MQRLNAIFAFVENEFDLEGAYFDLDSLADTKDRRDSGKLTQKSPVLSRELSRKIANYLLPVSIFKAPNTEEIDEIFRRINSGGRRLSGQELRQAGSTAKVAQLVRVFASRIRGDSTSKDIVPLKEMPNLSINNRHLDYGVDVDSIFWVQQSILRRLDVRSSFDEQLVLDILVDCLVSPIPSSGTDTRDAVYGKADEDEPNSSTLYKRISNRIEVYGEQNIEEDFFNVYDELRAVLDASGERFVRLVVGRSSGGRYPRYFQAVYMAFWELIVQEGMRVSDRKKVASLLRGIGASRGQLNIPGGGGDWTAVDKEKNINAVKGAVRNGFEKVEGAARDAGRFSQASYLEKVLANSVAEQSLCELKQGLFSLNSSKREFDPSSWEKILKSITAIANDGPDSVGFLVIGVADNKEDADRIRQLDGVESVSYRGYEVVGIGREAEIYGKSLKEYFDWISDKIAGAKLQDNLRTQVSSSLTLIDYHGCAVLLIKVNCSEGPFFYDDQIYERHGSGTKLVTQGDGWRRIYKKFV
ncbi:hypothetical protein HUW46_00662 [Amycolatopsis sp. CA-230715]|nr:hypothetical protein HUW46_00662 [Amycolatopsis sp. CA-230715]